MQQSQKSRRAGYSSLFYYTAGNRLKPLVVRLGVMSSHRNPSLGFQCRWIRSEREECEERLGVKLCWGILDTQEGIEEIIKLWKCWREVQKNLGQENGGGELN